ncbi:UNVERIFIED_CONTAM: type IV secretory system conjugative DNA transfer family protein [Methylobacteriaceae bacterium AG10]|jgi:type IV secretion system protein VirD4|uniref:Type IV secretory system conjugative DNA transfer family protein n=1 Tax=Methylorubrum rhodesianum TaxID=29427 RepID=A0ABU9ZL38_9HYPH|nr:type IV secretory system conjugative DNA transfer family protein [Methylobacteriaceae bacterium AG10]
MSGLRFTAVVLTCVAGLVLGFPAAFLARYGFDPGTWPAVQETAITWFQPGGRTAIEMVSNALVQVVLTPLKLMLGQSSAFADRGTSEGFAIIGATSLVATVIAFSRSLEPLRHASKRFGDADWATPRARARMRTGLEIGLDPATRHPVRVEVEGNLITIAPPRRGKTSGLVLPNLAIPDHTAWSGPAVVVDPKGDAYRAAARRRTALGRSVRCLDPLNLAGGADRWNPLLHRQAGDILYLQSMAQALMPPTDHTSEGGAFFRDRASVVIVAALRMAIRDGHHDAIAAAALVRDPERLLHELEREQDAVAADVRAILTGDERSRSNILSTAAQAFSWALDPVMQAVAQNHTFDLADLCAGETDLFVVLPADDRRTIIAPYVRWLLADLFGAVRAQRVAERLLVIVDEAFVLGAFDSILSGAGELPGYGVSLWTFWQSEAQLTRTYGQDGAAILRNTAEVIQYFNISRDDVEGCRRLSDALGTYTGVDETETRDPKTGQTTKSRSAVAAPLVPATGIPALTQNRAIVFLNMPRYTTDPLKLAKTRAFDDPRFTGLLDPVPPVGPTG